MNFVQLLILAAIWGSSFLFMKIGGQAFGVIPLIALRVGIATLVLLPLVLKPDTRVAIKTHYRELFIAGISNCALPFCLFTYAAYYLDAGVEAILNAMTPISTAIVGFFWLRQHLTSQQVIGLVLGFSGVIVLAWNTISQGALGTPLAVAAALCATVCYGVGNIYTKRKLNQVKPEIIAFGSQLFAMLSLLPLAIPLRPHLPIAQTAWIAVIILGALCTGIAYLLYFRLLQQAGSQYAASVTLLVPIFGMIWGTAFLNETITSQSIIGCAIILMGTILASGNIKNFALFRLGRQ